MRLRDPHARDVPGVVAQAHRVVEGLVRLDVAREPRVLQTPLVRLERQLGPEAVHGVLEVRGLGGRQVLAPQLLPGLDRFLALALAHQVVEGHRARVERLPLLALARQRGQLGARPLGLPLGRLKLVAVVPHRRVEPELEPAEDQDHEQGVRRGGVHREPALVGRLTLGDALDVRGQGGRGVVALDDQAARLDDLALDLPELVVDVARAHSIASAERVPPGVGAVSPTAPRAQAPPRAAPAHGRAGIPAGAPRVSSDRTRGFRAIHPGTATPKRAVRLAARARS
jgi:hypothetical protein